MSKLKVFINAPVGTSVASLSAGEVFIFSGSANGNNGPCIRVKDSKEGKGRFVNLSSGKLLKATPYDRADTVKTARLDVRT